MEGGGARGGTGGPAWRLPGNVVVKGSQLLRVCQHVVADASSVVARVQGALLLEDGGEGVEAHVQVAGQRLNVAGEGLGNVSKRWALVGVHGPALAHEVVAARWRGGERRVNTYTCGGQVL